MHKSATKCNKTKGKWCKNKHGASKIIDTFETYHTYIEEHPQPVHEDGEETEDNSVQPFNTWEFPYQQSYFDYGPSASSSREPDYDHANDDPPAWGDYRSWD
jgi:hypothetical protein